MASNLPPGCRDSDIPGNRPEDLREEALMERIHACIPHTVKEKHAAFIAEQVRKLIEEIWAEAYAEGDFDATMAAAKEKDEC